MEYLLYPISTFVNVQSMTVSVPHRMLAYSSLFFGFAANVSIVFRMLEIKIKATTRLGICGGVLQAVFSLIQATRVSGVGFAYTLASSLVSLAAAALSSKATCRFSLCQRQLVILTITTLAYLVAAAAVFSIIEAWDYEDALYWTGNHR